MADLVYFRVNTAGSWARLVCCPPERVAAVKDACEVLAAACGNGVSFKACDMAGTTLETFHSKPRAGEPHGWHAPR